MQTSAATSPADSVTSGSPVGAAIAPYTARCNGGDPGDPPNAHAVTSPICQHNDRSPFNPFNQPQVLDPNEYVHDGVQPDEAWPMAGGLGVGQLQWRPRRNETDANRELAQVEFDESLGSAVLKVVRCPMPGGGCRTKETWLRETAPPSFQSALSRSVLGVRKLCVHT